MRISVITPTCNRPVAFAILETWMARQTQHPHEWIVSDGGNRPVECRRGQRHLHAPMRPGAGNFAANLERALAKVTGDVVIIAEDDDWYAPTHLETLAQQLSDPGILIAGDDQQRYYNIPQRKYRLFKNRGASLCQTGFSASLIPTLRAVIRDCVRRNTYGVDCALWARQPASVKSLRRTHTVLGIKGLPGQAGLGIGHRPQAGWTPDPHGQQLRAWIGDDADVYAFSHAAAGAVAC